MSEGLDRYQQMRDFGGTPEPAGEPAPERSEHEKAGRPRFVIQEHHATALHWDFRLERRGVLVSWAVPKGIPPDPRVNHLAVHTEDHPLSYFDFEGKIPEGNYGAGKVILWDQGTYEEIKFDEREVMVVLDGQRAKGKYVLFRTGGRGGRDWMIHRMDPPEDPSRELMPESLRPSSPRPVGELPAGAEWRYEVAWGGRRVAIASQGGRARAYDASGKELKGERSEVRALGHALGVTEVAFEAELVAATGKQPGTLMVSDLLWLEGHATTELAYADRRRLLEELAVDGDSWTTSPVYDDGSVLLDAARAQGLAGVICRRADQPWTEPPLFVPVAD